MGMIFQPFISSGANPCEIEASSPSSPKNSFFAQDPPAGLTSLEVSGEGVPIRGVSSNRWTCDYNHDGLDALLERTVGQTLAEVFGYEEGKDWYQVDVSAVVEELGKIHEQLCIYIGAKRGRDVLRISSVGSTMVSDSHTAVHSYKSPLKRNETRGTTDLGAYFKDVKVHAVMMGVESDGSPVTYLHYTRTNWNTYLKALAYIQSIVASLNENCFLRIRSVEVS